MTIIKFTLLMIFCLIIHSCGKVGPLTLPEDTLDKSVITYPCDEKCKENFEKEKARQKSVTLQTD